MNQLFRRLPIVWFPSRCRPTSLLGDCYAFFVCVCVCCTCYNNNKSMTEVVPKVFFFFFSCVRTCLLFRENSTIIEEFLFFLFQVETLIIPSLVVKRFSRRLTNVSHCFLFPSNSNVFKCRFFFLFFFLRLRNGFPIFYLSYEKVKLTRNLTGTYRDVDDIWDETNSRVMCCSSRTLLVVTVQFENNHLFAALIQFWVGCLVNTKKLENHEIKKM